MIPVRFGSTHREMVGFYHPPMQDVPRHPAVLICSPFGPEAIRSYRMMRLFADRLARAGCPVLRFDYFGTGDSPGDDESASIVGWAGDIGTAHRELGSRSGKSSISWLGARLGGSVCALAAQSLRSPLRTLVLWDPIVRGLAYLRLLAGGGGLSDTQDLQAFNWGQSIESLAFKLPDTFKNELKGFELGSVTRVAAAITSMVISEETAEYQQCQAKLAAAGIRVDCQVSHMDAGWTSDKTMNTGIVPSGILHVLESKLLETK